MLVCPLYSAEIPLLCRLWHCGRSDGGWGGAALCSWKEFTWWSTAAGVREQDPPLLPQPQGTVSCTATLLPSPGVAWAELVAAASQLMHKQARRLQTVLVMWTRAEQGMSWPAEYGSTFYGPAEELKTVSPPWRPASLARMASCSVPSGLFAGDTASLSPKNSASLGAECHPPSAHVREDKAGQRLSRAWEHGNIVCWEAVWIRNSQRISGLDKMPGRRISLLNSSNWTHL